MVTETLPNTTLQGGGSNDHRSTNSSSSSSSSRIKIPAPGRTRRRLCSPGSTPSSACGPRASATESWGANLPVARVKNDLAASEKGVTGTLDISGDCNRIFGVCIRLLLEMLGEILRSCGLGCLLLRLGFGAGSWRL